jgi:hypothetical protein
MSFRLTREAEEDVADIYRYSFENFGEAQADAYHDGLEDGFRLLADTRFWAGIMRSFAPACAAMNMKAIPSITRWKTPGFSSCACSISVWTRRGILALYQHSHHEVQSSCNLLLNLPLP